MILVDTSVWVDHFRSPNRRLTDYLNDTRVMCHPHVVCELACGNLAKRKTVINLLLSLPQAPEVDPAEILVFIEKRSLSGSGLGLVDVHLLASAELADTPLWTLDKRLDLCARRFGLTTSSNS